MERTSTANDLTDRLRRRLESERREIEELTASELKRLAENSRLVARNALRTIERDTEEATGRMRELLAKAWLRPLIVGLSLWLGFFGGSWATMRWLGWSIHDRIETLAELEADTWGIALRDIKGERYVVLPFGTVADPGWEVRDRPAVKLSNR